MTHIELYQSELDRFAYYPENKDISAPPYRFDDLMRIADDDLRVATILYWQCCEPDAWAFPETYHQENMEIGEYYLTEYGYELNPEYHHDEFMVEIVDDTEPKASTWKKVTFEVRQTVTLRVDVIGNDVEHAHRRMAQLMIDEEESISELVNSEGNWVTSYKEAGTPSDCREPLLYGFWDVHKD